MEQLRKTETEDYTYILDFRRDLIFAWVAGKEYQDGDYFRPEIPNGRQYRCVAAGESGPSEPEGKTTIGEQFSDGGVTWETEAADANSRRVIQSVNLPPVDGLTITSVSFAGMEVYFRVAGGVFRRTYVISIEVTTTDGDLLEEKVSLYVYAP